MPPPLLLPGTLIGDRYEVRGRPRCRGQVEIYHAWDRNLGWEVALKVIPPTDERTSALWSDRLKREARLIGRLKDETSVVRIYGFDSTDEEGDGRRIFFAVLEWMQGGSASEWAAGSARTIPGRENASRSETATRIAVGAARGLCAAHAKGILHLDVTPDNILLTADGTAKLADFGVAVELDGPGGRCTAPPLGKAGYASPEQEHNRPVNARSDVYSLGATYFHLLTGQTPARPGQDPTALDSSLPAVCAAVARKAIDPVPGNRYPSAAALLHALELAWDELIDPTLPAYLAWLQRVHGTLRLPVINRQVPLNRVYTALRVVPTSLEERRKTWRLLTKLFETGRPATKADAERVDDAEALARLVEFPHTLTLEFRDRPDPLGQSVAKPETLGDAYGRWPVLVILGDPGSGKTTIARWLVRAAAESFAAGTGAFQVRKNQIDPNSPEDETPVDLGRARLPVFLRAALYAGQREALEHRALSLIDFLASAPHEDPDHHIVYGDDAPERLRRTRVPPERISRLIRSAIDDRSALIVIDGLDEIHSDRTRRDVRDSIQEFIGEYARPDDGNLVILTSRIVGYQLNSLEGLDVGHVIVERMEEQAVHQFVRSWLGEVEPDPGRAAERAGALTAAIFDPARRGLRDLATNPLLAGVLTAVFHSGSGLPETRVELFEAAIQEFLKVWEERARQSGRPAPMSRERVVRLLEPLAESIHTRQTTGLLFEDDLRRELTRLLSKEMGFDETALSAPTEVVTAVEGLIELIREPIGLLVARYEKVYAFIHLAFQEYLAARYLLRAADLREIVENFRSHLDSPRWREPLLMALGRFAQDHPDRLIELVKLLLAEDGRYGDLLPRGALLVVAALPELARCPAGLVALLLERLLLASIEEGGPTRFVPLRELIEESIPQLRQSHGPAAESAIRNALGRPDLAPAAASLLLRHEWYTRPIGAALLQNRQLDSAAWGWPIHAALREMATAPAPPRTPSAPKSVQAVESERAALAKAETEEHRETHRARIEALEREHASEIAAHEAAMAVYQRALAEHEASLKFVPRVDLPADLLLLRRELEAKPELRERIVADPDWATLIVGLYGGVGDYRANTRMREYFRFSNFLQLSDTQRRAFLAFLKERWGEKDPVYDIAVHLDTLGTEWKLGWQVRPDFRPRFLAQESPLTADLILPALRSGRPAAALLPDLERYAREGTPTQRADAILGLVLLGAGWAAAPYASGDALERLALAFAALRDPVVRMSNHVVPGLSTLAHAEPDGWSDVVSATLAVMIEDTPAQVDVYALYNAAPVADRPYVLAELLVDRFLGGNDDAVYHAAVALDTFSARHTPPEVLVRALALAPITRYRRRSVGSYRWNLEQIPPRTFGADDVPAFVLTAVENIDRRISMVRYWTLGQILLPILRRQPDLLPEVLAIALRDVGDHSDRVEFVNLLVPGLADHAEIHREVRSLAEGLTSPYYRARALLRLLPFFPAERDPLLDSIRADVRRIREPHRCEQVMERLLEAIGGSRCWILQSLFRTWFGPASRRDKDGLVFEALQAASAIADPDDRARALARLASYLPTLEAKQWLLKALRVAMNEIQDDRRLAETVRLLMPQLAGFPEVKQRVLKLPRARTPRIREALFDLVGPSIGKALPSLFRLNPEGAAGWAAVAAAARLRDILPAEPSSCDPDLLWERLGSDFSPGAIGALKARAEAEGLTLTRTAAHVLDRLDEDQHRALDGLLPYLHSPEPGTTPILVDWLGRGAGVLRRQAALLLAERHGLTIETLPAVVSGLSEKNDLIRQRALQVVQHPSVVPEQGPTRPTSVVGLATLMELMQEALAAPESSPGREMMLQVVGNLSSDLIHDSPEIFGELINAVRLDPGAGRPVRGRLPLDPDPARRGIVAEALLGSAEAVSPAVWNVLLDGLRAGPIPVRMALLRLLMRMTFRSASRPLRYGLTPDHWGDVVAVLDRLAPDELPRVGIYLGDVEGIIDSAEAAADAATSPEARLAYARSSFERQIQPLADLLADPPALDSPPMTKENAEAWSGFAGPDPGSRRARLLSLLAGLGSRLLFASSDCRVYLRPSEATEQRFRRRADVLNVLCDWLRDTLSRGGPELGIGRLDPTLLLAVAQGASVQPDALPIRGDREELTRLLVGAAQFQPGRTGRCAALILLGRLLVANAEVLPALSSALLDVEDVREGALIATSLFRHHDTPGFLEALVGRPEDRTGLYHDSAITAFGFATLLETLGRSDRTKPTSRQWVLSSLAAAVRHPSTDRIVPLGYTAAGLPELPKLNQILYRILLRVAGVESPKRPGGPAAR